MLGEATGRIEVLSNGRTVPCSGCEGPADVRSRHVTVDVLGIHVYCSEECKERALAGEPEDEEIVVEAPPVARRGAARPFVVGGLLMGCLIATDTRAIPPPPPAPAPRFVFVPPPLVVVPAAPPKPSPEEQLRAQWTAELMKDAWVHPLNGPARRMPIRDSRVFGAERPGERPIECANGHCGVDIGGEVWGEPVLAAHDGVVDRVQRGPNEERGGQYVRIAHRDGTVFTQYFHLAAIPRWLEPGRAVRAGEVVGLVGDTGVKNSGPHLHFTISIRPAADQPERYIDPEPLIALWPVFIPGGTLSAAEVPGTVRGALTRKSRAARRGRTSTAAAAEIRPANDTGESGESGDEEPGQPSL